MKRGNVRLSPLKNQTLPFESSTMYGAKGRVPTTAIEFAIIYGVVKGVEVGTWLLN